MNKRARFSPEVRERPIRLVLERDAEQKSQWVAIGYVVAKSGRTAEMLHKWVGQAVLDQGRREGMTKSDRDRFKALGKLTKTKGGFPNDDSLLKLLYIGITNASKKRTMPIQNWNLTVSRLSIFFEGRLNAVLDLTNYSTLRLH